MMESVLSALFAKNEKYMEVNYCYAELTKHLKSTHKDGKLLGFIERLRNNNESIEVDKMIDMILRNVSEWKKLQKTQVVLELLVCYMLHSLIAIWNEINFFNMKPLNDRWCCLLEVVTSHLATEQLYDLVIRICLAVLQSDAMKVLESLNVLPPFQITGELRMVRKKCHSRLIHALLEAGLHYDCLYHFRSYEYFYSASDPTSKDIKRSIKLKFDFDKIDDAYFAEMKRNADLVHFAEISEFDVERRKIEVDWMLGSEPYIQVDKKRWFRFFKFDVQRCLAVCAYEDGMKYITVAEARFTPKEVLLACADDNNLKNSVMEWYITCMELMLMPNFSDFSLQKGDAMRKVVEMFMNRTIDLLLDYEPESWIGIIHKRIEDLSDPSIIGMKITENSLKKVKALVETALKNTKKHIYNEVALLRIFFQTFYKTHVEAVGGLQCVKEFKKKPGDSLTEKDIDEIEKVIATYRIKMSRHAYTNAVRFENGSMCLGLLFFFGIEHQIVRVELDEFVELMTFFYGIHLMEPCEGVEEVLLAMAALNHARVFYHKLVDKDKEPDFARFCRNIEASALFNFPHPFKPKFDDDDCSSLSSEAISCDCPRRRTPQPRKSKYTETTNTEAASEKDIEAWFDINLSEERKMTKKEQKTASKKKKKKKKGKSVSNDIETASEPVTNGSGELEEEVPPLDGNAAEEPEAGEENTEENAEDATAQVRKPGRVRVQNRFAAFQAVQTVVSMSKGDKDKPEDIADPKAVFSVIQERFSNLDAKAAEEFDAYLCCQQCMENRMDWTNITPKTFKHNCQCDVFLLKRKREREWTRVRHCPITSRPGHFELCTRVERGCTFVGCTFPHSELEKTVWEYERENKINLKGMSKKLKTSIQSLILEHLKNIKAPRPNCLLPTPSAPTSKKADDSPDGASMEEKAAIESAFKGKYEFQLGCRTCFPMIKATLHRAEKGAHQLAKQCPQLVLFAKKVGDKDAKWWRVRLRQSQSFLGPHLPCHYGFGECQMICRKGDLCTFPHNEIELALWDSDRNPGSTFTIEALLRIRRLNKVESVASIVADAKKAYCSGPCAVEFLFVCADCLKKGRIAQPRPGADKCPLNHPLKRVLVARSRADPSDGAEAGELQLNEIHEKPESYALDYCDRGGQCEDDRCPHAHSMIELDVWNTEDKIEQLGLPGYSRELWVQAPKAATPTGPSATVMSTPVQQQHALFFPFDLRPVCGTCHLERPPRFSAENKKTRKCEKGHTWIAPTYVSDNHKIRSPQNLCSEFYNLCNSVPNGRCPKGAVCSFAHSEAERDIWIWMRKNKIGSLDEIFKRCSLPSTQTSVKDSLSSKVAPESAVYSSDSTALPHGRNDSFLADLATGFYCNTCQRFLPDQRQYDKHVESKKHKAKCDRFGDYPWNYRAPELRGKLIRLCPKHLNKASCEYSGVENGANKCPDAHTQEELDEWNERLIYLRFQTKKGPEYGELEEYIEGIHDLMYEIKDSREGVEVFIRESPSDTRQQVASNPLRLKTERKNMEWIITVETNEDITVTKAFLLNDRFRHHFVLKKENEDGEDGKQLLCWESEPRGSRNFLLSFVSNIICPYSQQLVLHFGDDILVMITVFVEFAGEADLKELEEVERDLTESDRWTEINTDVIRDNTLIGHKSQNAAVRNLGNLPALARYLTTKEKELTPDNYANRMTLLLHLEEAECNKLVSSFNLKTTKMTIADRFESNGHLCIANDRTFFGRITLTRELCENGNPVANLFLDNVRFAWIRPSDRTGAVVECQLVDSESFGFDGRGRDFLWIVIPRQALDRFGWKISSAEEIVTVDCQFQHDPLRFDLMHAALKHVPLSKEGEVRVMPRGNTRFRLQDNFEIGSSILNPQQKYVLNHILSDNQGDSLPPLLICGSFGAGKTQTLGQALLRLRHKNRVLVCTHANSAADLYITRILHEVVKQSGDAPPRVLRIYYERRQTKHIAEFDNVMRHYCLKTNEQGFFNAATKEDIEQAQIIITTLRTAYQLYSLNLPPDTFTHILIDEAAQVLEAEALIPMGLAGPNTMLVLAGDPIQMQPVVHSREAINGGLQRSVLERLWSRYAKEEGQLMRLRVLMTVNYRSEPDLVSFISTVFYKSDKLISNIQCSLPAGVSPLTLVAVPGTEHRDADSTSRCNEHEAIEVEMHVKRILKAWPGVPMEDICVISAFYTQVRLIRQRLRKVNLKGIGVHTIRNVQGKEFRIIIISCVRTRESLSSNEKDDQFLSNHSICSDFLTDHRLINTAFTRAKSAVVVIADPVALLGIGNCGNIWESFMSACESRRSLLPPGTTVKKINDEFRRLKNPQKFPYEPKSPMQRTTMSHPLYGHNMTNLSFINAMRTAGPNIPLRSAPMPGAAAPPLLMTAPVNPVAMTGFPLQQVLVSNASKPPIPMTTAAEPLMNIAPMMGPSKLSTATPQYPASMIKVPQPPISTPHISQPVSMPSVPPHSSVTAPQQVFVPPAAKPTVSLPVLPSHQPKPGGSWTGVPGIPVRFRAPDRGPSSPVPEAGPVMQKRMPKPLMIVDPKTNQPLDLKTDAPASSRAAQPSFSEAELQAAASRLEQQELEQQKLLKEKSFQAEMQQILNDSKAADEEAASAHMKLLAATQNPEQISRAQKKQLLATRDDAVRRKTELTLQFEALQKALKNVSAMPAAKAVNVPIPKKSAAGNFGDAPALNPNAASSAKAVKVPSEKTSNAQPSEIKEKPLKSKPAEKASKLPDAQPVNVTDPKRSTAEDALLPKKSTDSISPKRKDALRVKGTDTTSAKPPETSTPALNVAAALQAKMKPSSGKDITVVNHSATSLGRSEEANSDVDALSASSVRKLKDFFPRPDENMDTLMQERARRERLFDRLQEKANAIPEIDRRNRNNNSTETEDNEEEDEEGLLLTPTLRRALELSGRVIDRMGRLASESGELQVVRETCGCTVVGYGDAPVPRKPWLLGLNAVAALRASPNKFRRALVLPDGRLRFIDTVDAEALPAWLEAPLTMPQPLPGAPGDELLLNAQGREVVGVLRPSGSWALALGDALTCPAVGGSLFSNGGFVVRNLLLRRVHPLCCRAKSTLLWREPELAFRFLKPADLQTRCNRLRYLGPGPFGRSEPLALLCEAPAPPASVPDLRLELRTAAAAAITATGLQTSPGAPLQLAITWQPTVRRLQLFIANPWQGLSPDSQQTLLETLLQTPEANHALLALQCALQFSSVEPRPALALTFEAYRPTEAEVLVGDVFGGAADSVSFSLRLVTVESCAITLSKEMRAWEEEAALPDLRLLLMRSLLLRHGTGAFATALAETAGPNSYALSTWSSTATVLRLLAELELQQHLYEAGRPLQLPFRRFLFCQAAAAPLWKLRALPAARSSPALKAFFAGCCRLPADSCTCVADVDLPAAPVPVPASVARGLLSALRAGAADDLQQAALDWTNFPATVAHLSSLHDASFLFTDFADVTEPGLCFPAARLSAGAPLERLTDLLTVAAVAAAGGAPWKLSKARLAQLCLWQDARDRRAASASLDRALEDLLPAGEVRSVAMVFCGLEDNDDLRFAVLGQRTGPLKPLEVRLPAAAYRTQCRVVRNAVPHLAAHLLLAQGAAQPQDLEADLRAFRIGLLAPNAHCGVLLPEEAEALLQVALKPPGERRAIMTLESGLACLVSRLQTSPQLPGALLLEPGLVLHVELTRSAEGDLSFHRLAHFDLGAPPEKARLQQWLEVALAGPDDQSPMQIKLPTKPVVWRQRTGRTEGGALTNLRLKELPEAGALLPTAYGRSARDELWCREHLSQQERTLWDGLTAGYGSCVLQAWDEDHQPVTLFANITKIAVLDQKVTIEFQVQPEHEGDQLCSEAKMVLSLMSSKHRSQIRSLYWLMETREPMSELTCSLLTCGPQSVQPHIETFSDNTNLKGLNIFTGDPNTSTLGAMLEALLKLVAKEEPESRVLLCNFDCKQLSAIRGVLPERKILELTEGRISTAKDVVALETSEPAELNSLRRRLRKAHLLVGAAHFASDPLMRDAGIRAAVLLKASYASEAAPLLAVPGLKHLVMCTSRRLTF